MSENSRVVEAYLGLGSNLGEREANLARAVDLLAHRVTVKRLSSLYITEPVYYRNQPFFLNAVCSIRTSLSPGELLGLAKSIELALGRSPTFPNGPRLIDIDILFYGDHVINLPDLIVPHPRVQERGFVLVPLVEIEPNLVHPVIGQTVREMLAQMKDVDGVKVWCKEAWNVRDFRGTGI